ncbi:MAG: hypothetical protein R3C61_16090 [Bacteroidia bacterium]
MLLLGTLFIDGDQNIGVDYQKTIMKQENELIEELKVMTPVQILFPQKCVYEAAKT